MNERVERLQKKMQEEGLGACVISDHSAVEYFIGRHFSCGERLIALIVTTEGLPKLVLNELFPLAPQTDFELVRYNDTEDGVQIVSRFLNGKVGIDKFWSAGFLIRLMALRPDLEMVDGNLVDRIRSVKDPVEQARMRQASLNNDQVMARVRELIQTGKSEKQLEQEINAAFRELADSDPSFETIVAFAENCADPHAVPSDKILEEGMSVIVDMGCKFEGYCSDMTRTYFIGKNTMEDVYDTVLRANLAGIAAVKPGVRFCDIDRACRQVIEEAGYGSYFIHRTGHGIGLSVHEPFDVSAVDEIVVEEGMCFSIEPGIYLPGVGGVRIEDLVLVTKDGCEVLNHDPKDQPVL